MNAVCWLILSVVHFISQTCPESESKTVVNHPRQSPLYDKKKLLKYSRKIPKVEESFIEDLVTGSIYTRNMNYIYINIGPDIKTPCEYSTCEKYFITGSSVTELQQLLQNRVHIYNHWIGTIFAVDTTKRVVIIEFSSSYMYTGHSHLLSIIRSYNIKSYMVIIPNNQFMFQKAKELILSQNLFNVFVAKQGYNSDMYILYEVCAFCHSGKTELKLYNIWKLGHGFSEEMKYRSSFKGEFYGASLKIGLTPLPPSSFIIGHNADSSPIYSGSDYIILQNLARFLNFEAVVKVPGDGYVCSKESAGQWVLAGYCKMLFNKEVDMAGFPTSLELEDMYYFDPTAVYYITGNTIISHNPPMETSLISSVSPAVLVMIIISYFTSAVSYWLISRYYYKQPQSSIGGILFLFFAILNLETIRQRGIKIIQMVILSAWIIVCFFGISVVFGEITSISTSPASPKDPINSIGDMLQRNVSWATVPGMYRDYYLISRKDVSDLAKRKSRSDMGINEGLQLVLDYPDEYVYYFPGETIDPIIRQFFLNRDGTSPFHISPVVDKEPSTYLTVLVNKDAPYRDAIAMKLLQLEAAGLVYHKFLPDTLDYFAGKRMTKEKKKGATYKVLNLGNIFVIFTLIPVIIIISSIVLAAECVIYYKFHTRNKNYKSKGTR